MTQYHISDGLPADSPCRAVRTEVFMEEQGFTMEFDEIDESACHILLSESGEPLAAGRVFPKKDEPGVWMIGRVAVRKPWRGRGFGSELVRALEEAAKVRGAWEIELSAQVRAAAFYEKLGYQKTGEIHLDEYCPHQTMRRGLE